MDSYILMLTGAGALILLVAWLPMVLKPLSLPLSLPMICVALGALLFSASSGAMPDPRDFPRLAERLTELIVIVALTGAGLKLDRRLGWRSGMLTWRLLAIGMPLSILGVALLGHGLLGLGAAAALLLGAALAPTDPVLASDVQVGPPGSGEEDEVRFTLTAEAGLNDGLAFPFVNLAILLAAQGAGADWGSWLATDVAWKLGAGLVIGWVIGKALGWVSFHLPNATRLAHTGHGFVALGATFLAYGLTELAHGYGFLAVFVAALSLRAVEREHAWHERLHNFADQIERLLLMVVLVLFGGALAAGLLAPLDGWGVVAALLFVLLVRPAAGMLALLGARPPVAERAAIAFFGIRGLGSLYYLAYALNREDFGAGEQLWAVLGATVLLSILVHGVAATPAMRILDRRRRRGAGRGGTP